MLTSATLFSFSLLIAAGDETTANQLSLITYLLLTHPHILARLVAEIDSAVDGAIGKDAEIIPYSVLKDLPYLDAVLREAMRLLPTTWAVTKRIAPEAWQHPTKPELYIPKGTRVEILNAALSSDTSIWGIDAAEFVPERWIGLGSKTEADFKYCFLPFSRGPRNCIGMGLAIMEMKMLLANVFRRFAIELVDQRLAKRERELKTVLFLLHAPAKGEMEVRVSRRCSN